MSIATEISHRASVMTANDLAERRRGLYLQYVLICAANEMLHHNNKWAAPLGSEVGMQYVACRNYTAELTTASRVRTPLDIFNTLSMSAKRPVRQNVLDTKTICRIIIQGDEILDDTGIGEFAPPRRIIAKLGEREEFEPEEIEKVLAAIRKRFDEVGMAHLLPARTRAALVA